MENGLTLGDMLNLFWSGTIAWGLTNALWLFRRPALQPRQLSPDEDSIGKFLSLSSLCKGYVWNTDKLVTIFQKCELVTMVEVEESEEPSSTATLVLHLRGSTDKLYITGVTYNRRIIDRHLVTIEFVDICDEFGHDKVETVTDVAAKTVFQFAHTQFAKWGAKRAE